MVSMTWRAWALVALAAVLVPSLATAADAVHLLSDHQAPASEAPVDRHDPLHGHHHAPTIPNHDHVVVLDCPRSLTARSSHTVSGIASALRASGPSPVQALVMTAAIPRAKPEPPPRPRSVILRV